MIVISIFVIFQIIREVEMAGSEQTQVVISHGGRMLFTGNNQGMLRCIKFPLTVPGEWQEYNAHASSISRVGLPTLFCSHSVWNKFHAMNV